MTLHDNIQAYLRIAPGGTAQSIATDLWLCGNRAATTRAVQAALHILVDAEAVTDCNGWYRLSEAAKRNGRGL